MSKPEQYLYPTLPLQQRPKAPRMLVFAPPASEILEWATVGELSPTGNGPQREKKDARVDAIVRFLRGDERNSIPNALLVAFKKDSVTLEGSEGSVATLRIPASPVATIVDGQHRLYGTFEYDKSLPMIVVGILDSTPEEEAFQFLVINNKAAKVPATHTKALLARLNQTDLLHRLKGARVAFDAEGIRDVDLVNSDPESPFFESIAWPVTPKEKRLVPATAVELSLDYLAGLGIPEFDDRDVRRSVFLAIWRRAKSHWPDLWTTNSRLIDKVGIVCLTRFVADLVTSWADSDELTIHLSDLGEIDENTTKILKYVDKRFWTTPWADKAQGGFDTAQGRERVLDALKQVYRNGRRGDRWHSGVDILDPSLAVQD